MGKPACHQGFWSGSASWDCFCPSPSRCFCCSCCCHHQQSEAPPGPRHCLRASKCPGLPRACTCTARGRGHATGPTCMCGLLSSRAALLSLPLCILHCHTGLHWQHPSSKIKLLKISGQQQQRIKPSTETFWCRGPVLYHRSHYHEASPGLTCTVHETYIPVENTKQINKEMYIKVPGSDNEVLQKIKQGKETMSGVGCISKLRWSSKASDEMTDTWGEMGMNWESESW